MNILRKYFLKELQEDFTFFIEKLTTTHPLVYQFISENEFNGHINYRCFDLDGFNQFNFGNIKIQYYDDNEHHIKILKDTKIYLEGLTPPKSSDNEKKFSYIGECIWRANHNDLSNKEKENFLFRLIKRYVKLA